MFFKQEGERQHRKDNRRTKKREEYGGREEERQETREERRRDRRRERKTRVEIESNAKRRTHGERRENVMNVVTDRRSTLFLRKRR